MIEYQSQPSNLVHNFKRPPNRVPISILATLMGLSSICMCFIGTILGALAIIFATQANSRYDRENYTGADSSAQVAYMLSIISLALSLVSILLFLFFWAIGYLGDTADSSSAFDRNFIDQLL